MAGDFTLEEITYSTIASKTRNKLPYSVSNYIIHSQQLTNKKLHSFGMKYNLTGIYLFLFYLLHNTPLIHSSAEEISCHFLFWLLRQHCNKNLVFARARPSSFCHLSCMFSTFFQQKSCSYKPSQLYLRSKYPATTELYVCVCHLLSPLQHAATLSMHFYYSLDEAASVFFCLVVHINHSTNSTTPKSKLLTWTSNFSGNWK